MYHHDQRKRFREVLAALQAIYGRGRVREVQNGPLPSKVAVQTGAGEIRFRWTEKPLRYRKIDDPPTELLPTADQGEIVSCGGLGGMIPEVFLRVTIRGKAEFLQLDTHQEFGRRIALSLKGRWREDFVEARRDEIVDAWRSQHSF